MHLKVMLQLKKIFVVTNESRTSPVFKLHIPLASKCKYLAINIEATNTCLLKGAFADMKISKKHKTVRTTAQAYYSAHGWEKRTIITLTNGNFNEGGWSDI